MTDTIAQLRKLAKEYRATMDEDVLHSWASDVAAALPALLDRVEAGEAAMQTVRGHLAAGDVGKAIHYIDRQQKADTP